MCNGSNVLRHSWIYEHNRDMVFPLFWKLDAHVQAVAKEVCASFNSLRSDAVRFALLDAAGVRETPPLTADIAWRAVFRCVSRVPWET